MGIRKQLSANKAYLEAPRLDRFDPFLRDVDLRNAFRALMDGDWGRLESFMETNRKAWVFSQAIVSPIVDIEPINLQRWADINQSPYARTLLAATILRDAFEARNMATPANSIGDFTYEEDEEVVEAFHQSLLGAEELLREVIRERPAMAGPWVYLLVSGRGLGVSLEELRQRFDNAHSRHPFRPDACYQYLQGLTEKWGGAQTAVFDFARWVEIEANPYSPAHGILPMAHIECGLIDRSGESLTAYLADEAVSAEIAGGLTRLLGSIPTEAPAEHLDALNAYALAISPQGPETAELTNELFARIDNRPTALPWSLYKESITDVFTEIQADQLRNAARHLS